MSNYVKTTDFAAKDALASGNPSKTAQGTQVDTEFNNIATAVATKEDTANKGSASGYAGLDGSGDVPRANLPDALAYEDEANTFTQATTFNGQVNITAAAPTVLLTETGVTANNTKWRLRADAEQLLLSVFDDAVSSGNHIMVVNRTGTTVDSTDIRGTSVTINGHDATDADTLDGEEGTDYHDASQLTGTLADGRVAQSNVTQHQSALALTGDQVVANVPSAETGSFAVSSSHNGDIVQCNAASTITVTINTNALGATGRACIFVRMGAGAVTFTAGGGVTLRRPGGGLDITQQYGSVGLVQLSSSTFLLTGNI